MAALASMTVCQMTAASLRPGHVTKASASRQFEGKGIFQGRTFCSAVPPRRPTVEQVELKAALGGPSPLQVAGAAALSLLLVLTPADGAEAYKGGGPYGMEVTRGLDLSQRDFSGLDLSGQDFKTSVLRQCKFVGAKLLGTSFFDANLTGADFTDADLRGADFSLATAKGANFSNAILEGALVTGNTSFSGAIITGADFTDVYWRDDQKNALCKIADGVNPVTGNSTRDTLFC